MSQILDLYFALPTLVYNMLFLNSLFPIIIKKKRKNKNSLFPAILIE